MSTLRFIAVRTVEPPVYFTHADLQRRYGCSRMWVPRQIQKNHFPEPIKFGNSVGVRPRWSRAEVEQWDDEWLTAPLQRSAAS